MTIEGAPSQGAEETRPSLHDTLTSAFDEAKVDAPEPSAATPAAPAAASDGPKVDATGRAHAADGKFAPKETEAPAAAPAARPKRPDSWAKEYWDHWEKIDPVLADYLSKRESQYLQGVSTYKQEYERVKPIAEALQPYQQYVQAVGGAPQFIKALADTHQTLSGSDTNAKLRRFAQFAKEYNIPLEQLLIQGDDGKVYLNQTYFEDRPQQQQAPQIGPQEIEKIVQQKLAIERINNMVAQFAGEKGADGQPSHPHFEKVKASMDGLLRSGLVKDLQSAYDAALKLPQHADIAESDRLQRDEQAKAAEAKAKEEAAARAKANVISPKNRAPTALVTATTGKKGLRSQLEEAFDANASGRV